MIHVHQDVFFVHAGEFIPIEPRVECDIGQHVDLTKLGKVFGHFPDKARAVFPTDCGGRIAHQFPATILVSFIVFNIPSTNQKVQLGEFEEMVFLTVGVLYGDAHGVAIKEEIEKRLQRKVSVGALQSALRRMERKVI